MEDNVVNLADYRMRKHYGDDVADRLERMLQRFQEANDHINKILAKENYSGKKD